VTYRADVPTDPITTAFRRWGKTHGYRRKGTTLYREMQEVLAVVNLQGSQWGGRKYINVCWWLLALGEPDDPRSHRCHIVGRLDSLVSDEQLLARVLNDEGGLSDEDREQLLRQMLDDHLASHYEATQTLPGIRANEGDWLADFGVDGEAQALLGLPRPIFPSRTEARQWLAGLANGTITPRAAARWAAPFLTDESTHPDVMPEDVWEAIELLAGADLEVAPDDLLHGPEDFAAWLGGFDAIQADRQ
jgi:hypothetical protein